jgi:hypothetical protein
MVMRRKSIIKQEVWLRGQPTSNWPDALKSEDGFNKRKLQR